MEETKTYQSRSKATGHEGEDEACRFITNLGYSIVKRNFIYGRVGEIDIVAMDGDQLVFIEVKARTNTLSYGKPEDAVDWRKQKQLKRVAEGYYHINKLVDQACRFDVIAVDKTGGTTEIRHIKTAFY
ncbi:MAG: YraN family protein [Bacteroidota bacterium]|nr:YraN family protein [Bacteroidota bacterium]MDP4230424.1 YraN family protein [Bacteroidota bacterium]MDP4237816.1 YraN family protein [Bacteroidota bacterium]